VQEAQNALRSARELGHAGAGTIDRLSSAMVRVTFPDRSVMFYEGDSCGPAYLVESGRVWLTAARVDGSSHFLADMGPGAMVGEMTALLERKRIVTATTVAPVVAWSIAPEVLRSAVRNDVGLAYQMLVSALELVLAKNIEAALKAGQSASERVASVLLELTEKTASWNVPITHADLALMSGMTRESVSRTIATLRDAGILATRRRAIVVLDAARLAATAQGS
jgi:CRP/FNR family cyclic AMP-dependent transcriptional regulator